MVESQSIGKYVSTHRKLQVPQHLDLQTALQTPEYIRESLNANRVALNYASGSTSGTAFDVLSLTPSLWLDATDSSTIENTGDFVDSWNDKSANGLKFEQETADSRPKTGERTIGAQNAIFADDTAAWLEVTTQTGTQVDFWQGGGELHFVLTIDSDGGGDTGRIIHSDGQWTLATINQSGNNFDLFFDHAFSGDDMTVTVPMTLGTHNISIRYDALAGVEPEILIDGEPVTISPTISTGTAVTTSGELRLFEDVSASQNFNGTLAEMVGIPRLLNVHESAQLQNYLQQKYFSDSLPSQFQQRVIWFDINDESTITKDVSNVVTTVGNKEASADNDITQAVAANRPLWVPNEINGRAILRFDGMNDVLQSGTFGEGSLAQPNTFFIVLKDDPRNGTIRRIFGGITVDDSQVLQQSAPDFIEAEAGSTLTTSTQQDSQNFHIYTVVFNTTSSEIFKDGVSIGTGDVGSEEITGFTLAANDDESGAHAQIDVAEVVMYSRNMTAASRQIVELGLHNRYGSSPP